MSKSNGRMVMTMSDDRSAEVLKTPSFHMEHVYIPCSCSDDEHGLHFMIDPKDVFPLYCSVFLSNHRGWRGFFKRCWLAIRYVFGYKCKYGHFAETLFEEWHVKWLRDLCEELLRRSERLRRASSSSQV